MKVRSSFVSNSSSSSFIIASNQPLSSELLLKGLGSGSPLDWFVRGLADFIETNARFCEKPEDVVKNMYYDRMKDEIAELFRRYPFCYTLCVASDEDSFSSLLHGHANEFMVKRPGELVIASSVEEALK